MGFSMGVLQEGRSERVGWTDDGSRREMTTMRRRIWRNLGRRARTPSFVLVGSDGEGDWALLHDREQAIILLYWESLVCV